MVFFSGSANNEDIQSKITKRTQNIKMQLYKESEHDGEILY